MIPALSIPSPPFREFHLGPLPIRMYALCIITGVVVGTIIATRRWIARGGARDTVETVALVSVPFGIVGARAYHVITDHQLYFGPGQHPIRALYIWDGGLGIWGGVALGALGGYLVARRRKIRFWALADALAPGVVVAQAIGRLGNYFNQELYGGPTTLPWGLQVDPQYRMAGYEQYATFHPTFLYELLWDLAVGVALVLLDRRFKLGHGKVFALYAMFYTAGRAWVEHLRIDPAHRIDGLRLNDYTSGVVFLVALVVLLLLVRFRPGREEIVEGDRRYVDGVLPDQEDVPAHAEVAEGIAHDAAEDPQRGDPVTNTSSATKDDGLSTGDGGGSD
ncbi:prolipoprotein diacylglyceryl transferase 2 [Microlunatus endophyticus]|uniref:Phosphatidylglycerol--prolipoprotein diacylglyceryl transferase n=1 Tax=Microlunatus endophyticus TaxID=1716077 RepID=A0A917S4U7_9ACTN|nr:prolipoprotein diacylglyceryl transferase [Microlunatus endophyticus]GGL54873.1 prolipoprotein diacylglyceryl transferase 2 [Microlunatus endophyticus]